MHSHHNLPMCRSVSWICFSPLTWWNSNAFACHSHPSQPSAHRPCRTSFSAFQLSPLSSHLFKALKHHCCENMIVPVLRQCSLWTVPGLPIQSWVHLPLCAYTTVFLSLWQQSSLYYNHISSHFIRHKFHFSIFLLHFWKGASNVIHQAHGEAA